MDEEAIKKRVTEIMQLSKFGAGPGQSVYKLDLDLYRAAYADGLEKAAKLVDSHAGELTREMCDGCGNEDDVATGAMNDQARDIAAEIRQQAKEMGHE